MIPNPTTDRTQSPSRSGPPGTIGLRRLIERKRAGTEPLDLALIRRGFKGWHERGYLPHFDAPNVTQMVTFMLADSFPVKRRTEWEPILKEPDDSGRRRKLEYWLDRGAGECWLQNRDIAALVDGELRRFDGTQYRLQAWVVMPNHVHLVVEILDKPLTQLLKRWKGVTARGANSVLSRCGAFWQEDYYDTQIRDPAHLARAIRYVEQNPMKAKLVGDPRGWQWGSARHRDDYERLPWQCEVVGA